MVKSRSELGKYVITGRKFASRTVTTIGENIAKLVGATRMRVFSGLITFDISSTKRYDDDCYRAINLSSY